MKFLDRSSLYILLALCVAVTSQASEFETEYSIPDNFEYCFSEVVIEGGYEDLKFNYNFVIENEDHVNNFGNVFVAARFESMPGKWWLKSSGRWTQYNEIEDVTPESSYFNGNLPRIITISIFNGREDVSAMIGDAELWLGYGLGSDPSVAFDEMLNNERFSLVWQADVRHPEIGLTAPMANLCISPTKLVKKIIHLTTGDILASPTP